MLFKYIKWELERLHVGVWLGLLAMLSPLMVPAGANATGQLTARSVTVSNSAGAATAVTYTVQFTPAASQTLGGIKVEICDSPLSTSSCVNSGGSSGASFTSATLGSVTGPSGVWTIGTHSGNSAIFGDATPATSYSSATTLVINGVVNPTAVNTQYYVRVSTYTNATATTPTYPGTDFGAAALSTTQSLTVAANVQESLTFCTGTVVTPANCGAESGSTVNIGTGADNVLSTSPSGAISTMIASTNATSGYTITYFAANLSSTSDTITALGATKTALPAVGTAAFGINLMNNTSPLVTNSAAATGGSGADTTNYATSNQFAFVPSTATSVATAAGPTLATTYTVSYVAQAGSTTKPGAFSTTFNYVATGLF